MFDFIMKNLKESHIKLKLVRNLCILKVFHLNIIKKKLNEFKEAYKNNLLFFNLIFILFLFFLINFMRIKYSLYVFGLCLYNFFFFIN